MTAGREATSVPRIRPTTGGASIALKKACLASVALVPALACAVEVTSIGSESDPTALASDSGASGAGDASASDGSAIAVDASAVAIDARPDSCTSSASLYGSYYLSYQNGAPFADAEEHDAQIVLTTLGGTPTLTVEHEQPVSTQVSPTGFAWFGLDYGEWNIGPSASGELASTGAFGPDDASFTWTLNEALTAENFAGMYAGVQTKAALAETSACEISYEVTHVRDDYPSGDTPPTAADLVIDKFILERL